MKKLLVFDASNYMFRAFYASPPMNNSAGFPTNALHFYTQMVLSVIRRVGPDAIAMAHDVAGPKFRHALYPDYKGQREAPPEELQMQFPWFRRITDALGLPAYEYEGFEADDVIATLTRQARSMGWHVVIASSDKDLMQLVERNDEGDAVILLDALARPGKNAVITVDEVKARFQVAPERVADVLALAGDTIDNIPGCKGVGEKTAGKLIAEYGSLENLMQNLDKIKKPAQHNNLVAFAPNAELSKRLTSLVYDVPVTLRYEGMHPDAAAVTEIFSGLELHKLLTEVLGPDARPDARVPRVQLPGAVSTTVDDNAPEAAPQAALGDAGMKKRDAVTPATVGGIPVAALSQPIAQPALVRDLMDAEVCADVAQLRAFYGNAKGTVALFPLWLDEAPAHRTMLGCAVAHATGAVYVPVRHSRTLFGDAPDTGGFLDVLLDIACDGKPKAVYGLKPWVQLALRHGRSIEASSYFDVELAAYDVRPDVMPLADVCTTYLGYTLQTTPENWLGTGKKAVSPLSFTPEAAARVSAPWAQLTLQLAERLPAELEHHGLASVYADLDLPLCPILAAMEFHGIRLDTQALATLSRDFDAEMRDLDARAHAFGDDPFNINSPKDLARYLFDVLGLTPATKKKRTHGLSTDQETLESLDHPIAPIILEYRALSKLRSSYSETLAQMADAGTHRIHGRFHECVTATTRLSSSDPNLQNIPGRTELGRKIKQTFVAEEGWTFLSADYSQIELRLMAAMSREPVLCTAYQNGEDVHARTAATLFDIPIEAVTKAQRQLAKTINFGLLYGMGAQKLARETGYTKAEAKSFLEKFHAQFPTLSAFFDAQVEGARTRGETRTVFGHRRPIPELFNKAPMIRAFGERVALNAPVQGSASDIVKRAMIRLDRALREHGLRSRLLIQVHDELLLECPDDELEKTAQILRDAMENAAEIGVPLRVEMKSGKNWADMQ